MKKMTKQRLMGLALVAISAAVLWLASTGETVEDRDATAVLITLPLGIYALVTKEYILYDGDAETGEEPEQEARAGPRVKRHSTRNHNRRPRRSGHGGEFEKGVTPWHENAL